MKNYYGEITLKINTFFAEDDEDANQIFDRYINSLAQVGNNALQWDEVDWEIQEEKV